VQVPDPGPLRLQSRVWVAVVVVGVVLVVVVVVAGAAVAAGAVVATGTAAGAGVPAGWVVAGEVCVERWRRPRRCDDFGRAFTVGDRLVSRRVSTRRRTSTGAAFACTAPRRRAWGCGARGRRVCGPDRATGAGAPARG
jgi:hypothetical protein